MSDLEREVISGENYSPKKRKESFWTLPLCLGAITLLAFTFKDDMVYLKYGALAVTVLSSLPNIYYDAIKPNIRKYRKRSHSS